MKDYQKQFLELALDAKVLEFGDFTLKSGRKSPYFFNASKMLNGGYLHHLAECYRQAIIDSNITFDCIYGPAYKGIFLGSIVSMILSKDGGEHPRLVFENGRTEYEEPRTPHENTAAL